jgi:hypothetical protein
MAPIKESPRLIIHSPRQEEDTKNVNITAVKIQYENKQQGRGSDISQLLSEMNLQPI